MEPRWSYARNRSSFGDPNNFDLTVLLNRSPVGRVWLVWVMDKSAWHWRITMTQDHGHSATREGALNALRDSLTAFLDGSI